MSNFWLLLLLNLYFLQVFCVNNYCKLSSNHTMCLYKSGKASRCKNYSTLRFNRHLREYVVNLHNDVRNTMAGGYKSNKVELPPASGMNMLVWDIELASIAQRWADQCLSHNDVGTDIYRSTTRFDVGQNSIAVVTETDIVPDIIVLILNWFKEVEYLSEDLITSFSSDVKEYPGLGSVTQMIWAKTNYVGCALTTFEETSGRFTHRLICNYGPAGNVLNEPIYNIGSPCTQCDKKKCDDIRSNLCSVHSNLQIIQGYHFVGGNKSEDPLHPAFNPTIFLSKYKHQDENDLIPNNFKEPQLDIVKSLLNTTYNFTLQMNKLINILKTSLGYVETPGIFGNYTAIMETVARLTTNFTPISKQNDKERTFKRITDILYLIDGEYYQCDSGKWQSGDCVCQFSYYSSQGFPIISSVVLLMLMILANKLLI